MPKVINVPKPLMYMIRSSFDLYDRTLKKIKEILKASHFSIDVARNCPDFLQNDKT